MQGFIRFNKGVLRMSWPVKIWLLLLVAANAVAPLFFLQRVEAQAVLAAMMIGATLMSLLTARFGFTRILGLGHIFWIPLVGWLAFRLGQIPADDAFGIWIRGVLLLNAVSLVIDIADVIRYATGDRKELVTGL
ncbi:MAG: hypothetical protein IH831_10780 [Planctomycetes bacterium]|nr:hypothetical protein [Planctomycetota bacterium]